MHNILISEAIQGRLVNPDDDEIAQTIKNWLKGCTKRIESNKYEYICIVLKLSLMFINMKSFISKRLAKRSDPLPLTNSPSVYN